MDQDKYPGQESSDPNFRDGETFEFIEQLNQPSEKKRKRGRRVAKGLAITGLTTAVVAGGGYGVWQLYKAMPGPDDRPDRAEAPQTPGAESTQGAAVTAQSETTTTESESPSETSPSQTEIPPVQSFPIDKARIQLPAAETSGGKGGNETIAPQDLDKSTNPWLKRVTDLNGTGIMLTAPAYSEKSSNRASFMQVESGGEESSWNVVDGARKMELLTAVNQLPENMPQVAIAQIANEGAEDEQLLTIRANGLKPSDSTNAVNGTSPEAYTIDYRFDGKTGKEPIIENYRSGEPLKIVVEASEGSLKIFADKITDMEDPYGQPTLRVDRKDLPSALKEGGNYFEAGAINPARGADDSPETVPAGTGVDGKDLTFPPAGSEIPPEGPGSQGVATFYGINWAEISPETNTPNTPTGTSTADKEPTPTASSSDAETPSQEPSEQETSNDPSPTSSENSGSEENDKYRSSNPSVG